MKVIYKVSIRDFIVALCTNIIVNTQYKNIRLKKVSYNSGKKYLHICFQICDNLFWSKKEFVDCRRERKSSVIICMRSMSKPKPISENY